ncbi:MerR family transcriptional regulator [Planosporangium mesophilum]|uniref:MerR family transcriptional regulator n=1 Tax=Planosporangium mesophilum TaxID=689768 RepID=A0A8J3T7R1_9ACTN|nr:MerR family transcriptional regulator [Planosporangium mesophilum]NJC81476.1 MerR family transcriptional regulator [Planosporangium mesophilum]GII20867.1 MerR family transcriptional regulator [Planosporangium mesophilum]
MRIGELSRLSQVSVATIKYYLREDLLPPGTATATNQATYTEAHVRRLRLIRALIDVGGLSVARARDVIAAVDAGDLPPHTLLGIAHGAVTRPPDRSGTDPAWHAARTEVVELVHRRGWSVSPDSPGLDQAADAIRALRTLGQDDLLGCLETYADAAELVAGRELDIVVARADPTRMVEGVITGTVLGEVLLASLRLLAQQDASARHLGAAPPPTTPTDQRGSNTAATT